MGRAARSSSKMSLSIRPLFTMLQDEPAAEEAATEAGPSGGGDVSFPDDYPNSVKHFLLIGCLGMLIGSCVFLWLAMARPKSLIHVLMFMSAAISTMCFYAMWTGVGVELKTTDVRVPSGLDARLRGHGGARAVAGGGPARSHRPRGQAGFRPLPCLQLRGHCGRGCRRWHEPAVAAVRLNSGVTWRASVCVDLVRVAGPAQ